MKITIIHGQSHKGSTYYIARRLTQKLGGEVTEFFLPRDFDEHCIGCTTCFMEDGRNCPHYERLEPITRAMDEADVLIFASPVYVFHLTGSMKVLLDHYGYRWMVHRPEERMFTKQAVCISTAAGAGTRSTNKDMADSLFFWGVAKIYRIGIPVYTTAASELTKKTKKKIERKTTDVAERIQKEYGHVQPGLKTKALFWILHFVQKKGWNPADAIYWKEKGWTRRKRPWKDGIGKQ